VKRQGVRAAGFAALTFLATGAQAATTTLIGGQRLAAIVMVAAVLVPFGARKSKIGGWLMFYFFRLYGANAAMLLFLPDYLRHLRPSPSEGSWHYALVLLGSVPTLLVTYGEVVVGTMLLFKRNKRTLRLLKAMLLLLAFFLLVSFAVDRLVIRDGGPAVLNLFSAAIAGLWFAYFTRSRRVRMLFIEKIWDYSKFAGKDFSPTSPLKPGPISR